jgi:hypothetical protein
MANGGESSSEWRPRQFAEQYQEQRQLAEGLEQDLKLQGRDTKGLSQVIQQMRALEAPGAYKAPNVAQLAESVMDGLKNWEFELRKQLEAINASRPALGSTGAVPPDYEALVSDYYRSLAKKP